MPKVQFSALVTDMKGVQNGSIWSKNAGGNYYRNRVSGGGLKSTRWQTSKGILVSLASQWRFVPNTDKQAWQAMTVNYPTVDKFGRPRIPSGYELFCRLNAVLVNGQFPPLLTPVLPGGTQDIGTLSLLHWSGTAVELLWTNPLNSNIAIQIYASPPISQGITRQIARKKVLQYANGVSITNAVIGADLYAAYPVIPSGSQIQITAWAINTDTGEIGNEKFLNLTAP